MCPPKTGVFGVAGIGVLAGMLTDSLFSKPESKQTQSTQGGNVKSKGARIIGYTAAVVFGIPLFIGALWAFKWWVIGLGVPGVSLGLLMYRICGRRMLVNASPALRAALQPQPALPRAMRRELTNTRRAINEAPRAIEGKVVNLVPLPVNVKVPVRKGRV